MKTNFVRLQRFKQLCVHVEWIVWQSLQLNTNPDQEHEDLSIGLEDLLQSRPAIILRRIQTQVAGQFLKVTFMAFLRQNVSEVHHHTTSAQSFKCLQLAWMELVWDVRLLLNHWPQASPCPVTAVSLFSHRKFPFSWSQSLKLNISTMTPCKRCLSWVIRCSRSTAGNFLLAAGLGCVTSSLNCPSTIVCPSKTSRFSTWVSAWLIIAPSVFWAKLRNSFWSNGWPGWPTANAIFPIVSRLPCINCWMPRCDMPMSEHLFSRWATESTIEVMAAPRTK